MESVNERQKRPSTSRTTVIYKRQSWEEEVVGERNVRQGRGRPRKQYLVQGKQSWVDGGRLTAPELLQNWKEKKALRCRFWITNSSQLIFGPFSFAGIRTCTLQKMDIFGRHVHFLVSFRSLPGLAIVQVSVYSLDYSRHVCIQ